MRFLVAVLCLVSFENVALARRFFDGRAQVPKIEAKIQAWQMAEETDKALDTIVGLAVKMLRDQRLHAEADDIARDWQSLAGHLTKLVNGEKDVGDFTPWSAKVAAVYAKIEAALGEEICHWARLDDMKSINHAVPVVFHLDIIDGHLIDLHEYGLHWDGKDSLKYNLGLAGTVAYWTTTAACWAVTWGAGAIGFVCSPAALVAERVIEQYVAPKYRAQLYDRYYGRGAPAFNVSCPHGGRCF